MENEVVVIVTTEHTNSNLQAHNVGLLCGADGLSLQSEENVRFTAAEELDSTAQPGNSFSSSTKDNRKSASESKSGNRGRYPGRKTARPVKYREFTLSSEDDECSKIEDGKNDSALATNVKTNTDVINDQLPPSQNEPLICNICEQQFDKQFDLNTHLRTHSLRPSFVCSTCNKSFKSRETLLRHNLSHTGEKPFPCSECEKGFSSALALREHRARHNDETLYQCKVCQRGFHHVSGMRRHLTTHSEERLHQCDVCGQRFSRKVYLTSHQKSHTKEKQYNCATCSKSFAHLSDLKRHSVIHTGEKPFSCTKCGGRFSDASSKRRHEKEHRRKKSFPCKLRVESSTKQDDPDKAQEACLHLNDENVECTKEQRETNAPEGKLGNTTKLNDQEQRNIGSNETTTSIAKEITSGQTTLETPTLELPATDDTYEGIAQSVDSKSNGEDKDDFNQLEHLISITKYISSPDFNSQEYYDWLSHFTSLAKLLPIPLELECFSQINQVLKTLTDKLAFPTEVLVNRTNFKIVLDISKDLQAIVSTHLTHVLDSLET